MADDSLINPFFKKQTLRSLRSKTPFYVFSKEALIFNLKTFRSNLPAGTEICFSMKANSEKPVLKNLYEAGANFEVASKYELFLLKVLNIPPQRIIYGSSVKPFDHIKEFKKYGVDRFAADSYEELLKINKYAPGCKVYIRALVDDKSNSVFHMSEKFGISLKETVKLLIKARDFGLIPYGISFNVGSQARSKYAWARGISEISSIIPRLEKYGIKIQIINIGGGFPHQYKNAEKVPILKNIAKHINHELKSFPHPIKLIAEPGRGLVANTYVLIVSVIEKIKRQNGFWLHLDAGVYNALLEAMAYQGSLRFLVDTLFDYPNSKKVKYILTGPACDDLDVIDRQAMLPNNIKVGDRLVIYDTGAYTFTLTTSFNGYPKPKTILL